MYGHVIEDSESCEICQINYMTDCYKRGDEGEFLCSEECYKVYEDTQIAVEPGEIMKNLIVGNKYLVGINKRIREFACYSKSGKMYFHDSSDDDALVMWNRVKEIPEPEIIPWTLDTCPLPPFTVQYKEHKMFEVVSSVGKNGVDIALTHIFWDELLKTHNYVVARTDIRPCGEVK